MRLKNRGISMSAGNRSACDLLVGVKRAVALIGDTTGMRLTALRLSDAVIERLQADLTPEQRDELRNLVEIQRLDGTKIAID